jgi:caffeoyl-CoA O-methyltransferase
MSSRTVQLTPALREYLLRVGVREPELWARLRAETAPLEGAGMQICPEQGALMHLLTKLMGARRVIEVGTFTGYSALALATALPDDGELVCCDISEEWTSIARRYWQEAGVADRVRLELAPALQTLDALLADGQAGTFDLAFVDADKSNYPGYHERCLLLLRTGGAILYDNVLWGGALVDPPSEDDGVSTRALRAFNEQLADDDRVELVMVPIGDGLTVCRKR